LLGIGGIRQASPQLVYLATFGDAVGGIELKRISDKSKIPFFFNNKRYDECYKNYSVVGLTHEIRDRQNTSFQINAILKSDCVTPPPRTREQIIEDYKKSYLWWIEGRVESDFLDNAQLGRVPKMKRPLDILPRLLFDIRPYIQPIKEMVDDIETRSKYAFRRNVDEYDEYPAISINLDFSDDAILADIKKHLKKLRKQLKQRPKLLPPKEFIRKFKNFRTLQVIDILLWQRLTGQHIEYDTLAEFLFPQGQFTGKQLRETIIPFAKKLLDSNSNESAYLFYLSDQSSEK
jgi:hypothetical protein